MSEIYIRKVDETYIRIDADQGIRYELRDHFTFFAPNYRHHPAFKNKVWDGTIKLYHLTTNKIYAGLYDEVVKFAKDRGYKVISTYTPSVAPITRAEAESIYGKFNGVHTPHDHQIDSLYYALKHQRGIVLSPTSSGKSYFIYHLARTLQQFGKIMIVVPTVNLVTQLYDDFKEYSENSHWNVEDNCHKIHQGQEKDSHVDIFITTFQSMQKMPKSYFQKFKTIIGDEVHRFTAKSLKNIMENAVNAKFRIGCTGSLDDSETNELVLTGLFGPIHRVITTKQLMDEGKVADLTINCMLMEHKPDRAVLKMKYAEQMVWFCENQKRNDFIRKVVAGEEGNKLVLYQLVEKHGKPLYEDFKRHYPDKEIYFISGKTPVDEREAIRKRLSETDDAILIASYGTYSTGMNVPSLRHVFSTWPGKSVVRILQSIGRALRLMNGKTEALFWDFSDLMMIKSSVNISYDHFEKRMQLYAQEQFKVKIYKVKI